MRNAARWIAYLNRPLDNGIRHTPAAARIVPPIVVRVAGAILNAFLIAAGLIALWDMLM